MAFGVQREVPVLEPAVADGRINVSQDQARIIIRIEEKDSFPSGFVS